MRVRFALPLFVAGGLSAVSFAPSTAADPAKPAAAAPVFNDKVKAILDTSCVNCHNPSKKKAGVDLESLAGVMKTVKAGSPEQSRLYKSLIGAKGTKAMPPKKRLPADEVEAVKAWIAAGAKEK